MMIAVFTNRHWGNSLITTLDGEAVGTIPCSLVEEAKARLAAHDTAGDRQSIYSLLSDLLCGNQIDILKKRQTSLENANKAIISQLNELDEKTRERGFLPQTADGYFCAPGTVIWHCGPCGPQCHTIDTIDRDGASWVVIDENGNEYTASRDMAECYFKLENCKDDE